MINVIEFFKTMDDPTLAFITAEALLMLGAGMIIGYFRWRWRRDNPKTLAECVAVGKHRMKEKEQKISKKVTHKILKKILKDALNYGYTAFAVDLSDYNRHITPDIVSLIKYELEKIDGIAVHAHEKWYYLHINIDAEN